MLKKLAAFFRKHFPTIVTLENQEKILSEIKESSVNLEASSRTLLQTLEEDVIKEGRWFECMVTEERMKCVIITTEDKNG